MWDRYPSPYGTTVSASVRSQFEQYAVSGLNKLVQAESSLTLRMTAPGWVQELWKRSARRAGDVTEAACRNEFLHRLETDQLLFTRREDPLIEAFQAIGIAVHVLLIIRMQRNEGIPARHLNLRQTLGVHNVVFLNDAVPIK